MAAQRTSPGTPVRAESDKVGQPGGRHPAGRLPNLAVRLHLQGRAAVAATGNGQPETGGMGATGARAGWQPGPPSAIQAPPQGWALRSAGLEEAARAANPVSNPERE